MRRKNSLLTGRLTCSLYSYLPVPLSRPERTPDTKFKNESPEAHKCPPYHLLQPSAPASSSAIICLPLCSPSAYHQYGANSVGQPSSSVDVVGVSLTSVFLMAPPSVGSTVGRHYGCGLRPARLLLLWVPPVSFLAPPSFVTALVSVCPLPLPGEVVTAQD